MEFKVGMSIDSTDIFTGGSHHSVITERKGNRLKCEAQYFEPDGVHKVKEEYEVFKDDNGNEYIILWEYKGEQGILRAGYDVYGNKL